MTLARISWPEAQDRRLATARGFAAFEIPAGTIRRWAHEHKLSAVAKAPGGAHLYEIQEVSALAERMKHTPIARGACK
jgi:hypothetical protein